MRLLTFAAILIVKGVRVNETWQIGALSDSEDEDSETDEDVIETSDLQELFAAMKAANTNLMKMSLVIRNSPSRDDYLKAATRYPFDPRWDIGHVKEKHGSENRHSDWLLERLGKAITRRRQYLKYREEHHGKLSRDWTEEGPKDAEADDEPAKTIAVTEATKYVENEAPNQPQGSEGGGSFGSQTSYEATIVGESTDIRLTVPPPPAMAFPEQGIAFTFGEPFQCPFCYTEQIVKDKAAWKSEYPVLNQRIVQLTFDRKHVFHDLKPYVCTFKECNLRMFRSRNEWFAHEIQAHRREWSCARCQVSSFSAKANFESHLKTVHSLLLTGSELEAVVLQSEEPVDRISSTACHLCDDWQSSILNLNKDSVRTFLNDGKNVKPYGTLKQFRRHLGRHMEQLALFALPMHDDEAKDDSSGEDDGASDIVIDSSNGEASDQNPQEEGGDVQINRNQDDSGPAMKERLAKETREGEDRPRVKTMIRGKPIDITDLGIDVDVISSFPEDLREEVVMSAYLERRSRAQATGKQRSAIDQDFLTSLPEDIRDNILQQEQHVRPEREIASVPEYIRDEIRQQEEQVRRGREIEDSGTNATSDTASGNIVGDTPTETKCVVFYDSWIDNVTN